MYESICLMLPTYGRARTLLPKFIESAEAMSSVIKFSFCVSRNDLETFEYLNCYPFKFEKEIIFEDLPSPNLAKYFNMLYMGSRWKNDESVAISQLGDDMEFKTPGWDKTILNAINFYKGVGVFWANDDLYARERCCVNLFISREMVALTEHPFMCEQFHAEMIDVVWHEVGRLTKTLHFYPEIIIKHNHNTVKPKEQWDATFNRLYPIQKEAHIEGKKKAKEIAFGIAQVLIKKGIIGDSIC